MIQEKIIEILKTKHKYSSGEEISAHLKLSRQALWKHIQELRDIGYDIVAVPHLGYQLVSCPDKLLSFEIKHNLGTKFVGRNVHYFDTVRSTNDAAFNLGIEDAPEGTVVLAESQSRGKGRLGRVWESPKQKGIYLSLILKPKIAPSSAPILTLLTAISISEAIKEIAEIEVKIKWPNDLVVNNKKVGGILTEINAEQDRIHFIVIGCGINVNNDKGSLPQGATSLKEQKKEAVNRINLTQEVLRKIEENYLRLAEEGTGFVIEKWQALNTTLGKRIKVALEREHLEGEAIDIDKDGGLLVRTDSGFIQKVSSGDVVHCR